MNIELIIWILSAIGTYISLVWFVTFVKEHKSIRKIPSPKHFPTVSVVVPAYNEEKNIENTIKSLLNSDYPKNKLEIIVVNDGSTDNTKRIAEKYVKREAIKLINQKNMGKGAALNNALKAARGKLFGVLDADTIVEKDTITKLVGFFTSNKIGAVMSGIKPLRAKNLLEKFQEIEYFLSILIRKLMDKLETNYVTPGALSIYRKDVITKLGGFDENNITEDLEIGLRLRVNGYKIKTSVTAFTYTIIPNTLKSLFKQRMRWDCGLLINLRKYPYIIFNPKYNYLGMYQIPTVLIATLLLCPIAFGVTGYFLYKTIHNFYLYVTSVGLSIPELTFPASPGTFLLSLNLKIYYPLFISLFLSIILIILSQKIAKEKYRNILFILLTIVVYYFLQGVFWMIALFTTIFKIKVKW